MRALDARFSEDFRAWVSNLTRLFLWQRAGYQIGDELSFEDWQALAIINRWHEVKDLEATARLQGGLG